MSANNKNKLSDVEGAISSDSNGFHNGSKAETSSSCRNFGSFMSKTIGNFFYHFGVLVARNPLKVIACCLVVTLVSAIGLINLKIEERAYKLWVPTDSTYIRNKAWKSEHFPDQYKMNSALYFADNVLTKKVLLDMLTVYEIIYGTEVLVTEGVPDAEGNIDSSPKVVTWMKKCIAIPQIPNYRKRRSLSDFSTTSELRSKRSFLETISSYSTELYCKIIETTQLKCLMMSILEIWGYERSFIESLTDDQIIEDINNVKISRVFGMERNFTEFLSGVERDSDGKIIKATGTSEMWFSEINYDRIIPGKYIDLFQGGEEIDVDLFKFEEELTRKLVEFKDDTEKSSDFHFFLSQTYNKVVDGGMDKDLYLIPVGYSFVFLYFLCTIGKFNIVEARPILSVLGILSVAMSMAIATGVCNMLGIMNTMVNNALPFLLLALGIDDMFVIMQSFSNLSNEEKKLDLADRIGCSMRHAGTSILVTSVTDIFAFGVGALTSIPALKSFCTYASVGIIPLFVLQVTFFVACFKFDQARIESKGNALLFWKKVDIQETKNDKRTMLQTCIGVIYPRFLLKQAVKVFVLVFTLVLTVVSCWGLYNLQFDFNVYWFVPKNSFFYGYVNKYFDAFENAEHAEFYVGNISLYDNLDKIEYIETELMKEEYIGSVHSWYKDFKVFKEEIGLPLSDPHMTEEDFQYDLGHFLFSTRGLFYQKSFIFESELNCTGPAPKVLASRIDYRYKFLKDKQIKTDLYNRLLAIPDNLNLNEFSGPVSYIHASWEVENIMESELYTNLSVVMLVIFLITLALLSSLVQSLIVLFCVAITLVDTAALVRLFGLTLDPSTCVCIVLAVGISVDYSLHIVVIFWIIILVEDFSSPVKL